MSQYIIPFFFFDFSAMLIYCQYIYIYIHTQVQSFQLLQQFLVTSKNKISSKIPKRHRLESKQPLTFSEILFILSHTPSEAEDAEK